MVATLLRCIICLGDADEIDVGTIWSIRETFVGIITVNAPILQPFIVRSVRFASSKAGISGPSSDKSYHPGTHQLTQIERREKQNRIRQAMGMTTIRDGTVDNDSEERIVQDFDPNSKNNGVAVSAGSVEGFEREPNEIIITRGYDVSKQYV
ncbi:hypothetical protein PHISCL_07496 [Aspergillus sclerotialis]|uniref:Uncharacterized protein n=1 Tax=Aspergillus sclerotialis TaxID=2070753 RepID=A0A3A2ZC17_9EURO|nr:hypothetical protein PHISCL_07496 [Aspergillus sclerotialis]